MLRKREGLLAQPGERVRSGTFQKESSVGSCGEEDDIQLGSLQQNVSADGVHRFLLWPT